MTYALTSDFVHMSWNRRGHGFFKVGSLEHCLFMTYVLTSYIVHMSSNKRGYGSCIMSWNKRGNGSF